MKVDGKVVSGLVTSECLVKTCEKHDADDRTESGKAYQLQIMTECVEDCYHNEIIMSDYRKLPPHCDKCCHSH